MLHYDSNYYYTPESLDVDLRMDEFAKFIQRNKDVQKLIDVPVWNESNGDNQHHNLRFLFVVTDVTNSNHDLLQPFDFQSYQKRNKDNDTAEMLAWSQHYKIRDQQQWDSFPAWQMAQLFNLYRKMSSNFKGSRKSDALTLADFVLANNLNAGIDIAHVDEYRFYFLWKLYANNATIDLTQLSYDTFKTKNYHKHDFHPWQQHQYDNGAATIKKEAEVQPVFEAKEEEDTDLSCSAKEATSIIELILKVEHNQRELDRIQIQSADLFGDDDEEGY